MPCADRRRQEAHGRFGRRPQPAGAHRQGRARKSRPRPNGRCPPEPGPPRHRTAPGPPEGPEPGTGRAPGAAPCNRARGRSGRPPFPTPAARRRGRRRPDRTRRPPHEGKTGSAARRTGPAAARRPTASRPAPTAIAAPEPRHRPGVDRPIRRRRRVRTRWRPTRPGAQGTTRYGSMSWVPLRST